MMLVLIVIGLALGVGFVAGGSLRPFERLNVHWWGVALAGLVLQSVSLAGDIGRAAALAILVGSYGLLLAFAGVNRRLPASWLVMAGLIMNILVIGVNGRMPVSASALDTAGANAEGLLGAGTAKHHLMGPDDSLTALGDVIGIPPPVGAVISIGDVLLYTGVAILIVAIMLGRSGENRRPPARIFQGYRGKHLPPERLFSRWARAEAFPASPSPLPGARPELARGHRSFREARAVPRRGATSGTEP